MNARTSTRPLRRALTAAATAAAVATAGLTLAACGGGSDEAESSLDEALGFLPPDSGFVLAASTDERDYDDVEKVLNKFPFGGRAKGLLEDRLEGGGVSFEDDVKPLLGNHVVIGTADNASFVTDSSNSPFILAIETEDAKKLEAVAKDDSTDEGETEGYDVYKGSEDDTWLAIKDEVAVLSNDEDTLKDALERREGDDRLTEDDFEAAFEDLPEDAPAKVYVNLEELLATDPDTREALKVKWIDQLETLGLAAEATRDRVSLHYSLRTDSEGLADEDVPLATGDATPLVFEREEGSSEVALGLRELAHVVAFAESAAESVDPAGFNQYEAGKRQLGKRLGIDVDEDVIGQLTGDVAAAVTLDGRFGVRAELEDASAFERTLAKVMDGLPEFAEGTTVTPPAGGDGFYAVRTPDGERFAVGVAGQALVVASDAERAAETADRKLVQAPGQAGAFVAVTDAEQVANDALARFASGLGAVGGSLFTGPLGDLATSAAADTDGITGRVDLEIE